MIGTAKKPSVKRRSDSIAPTTNKKLKTGTEDVKVLKKNINSAKTNLKVKSKQNSIKPKAFKTSNIVQSEKAGSKSKPSFLKAKSSSKGNSNFSASGEKPNWTVIKKEKKEQKVARKGKKHGLEVYELSVKAKAVWEKLRTKSTPDEKKEPLCQQLFQLVKQDMEMLIHSHDLARVIQSLIKYGTPDMHTYIAEKLCGCFVKASTSKYGRFCVKAALKKCNASSRSLLVQKVLGHVVKLFCHKFGNSIVDDIYTLWAKKDTKKSMRLEFYGDLSKLVTFDPNKKQTILDALPDDLRPAILASMKLNLNKVLDKKDILLKSTLAHAVLSDYISICEPQDREEILEAVHTEVEHILTSKEGQKVAINVLWYGTNKMKKVAVKSIKGKVSEFAQKEFGHSFIMAMFDSVDDTVLLNKVVIAELLEDIDALLKNGFGRRVILYLVARRDSAYFHPDQMKLLKSGDSIRNSKKDDNLRMQELLAGVSKGILEKMCTDPSVWFSDSSTAMVMLAVLKSAQAGETLDKAYKALVDYILDPKSLTEVDGSKIHVIEFVGVHMTLKTLMKHEKENTPSEQNTFVKCLVDSLTNENVKFLLKSSRGAFTIVFMLENGDEKSVEQLKSKLQDCTLKKTGKYNSGLKVLMKKLEE